MIVGLEEVYSGLGIYFSGNGKAGEGEGDPNETGGEGIGFSFRLIVLSSTKDIALSLVGMGGNVGASFGIPISLTISLLSFFRVSFPTADVALDPNIGIFTFLKGEEGPPPIPVPLPIDPLD